MKISKMIDILQKIYDEHGDCEIFEEVIDSESADLDDTYYYGITKYPEYFDNLDVCFLTEREDLGLSSYEHANMKGVVINGSFV